MTKAKGLPELADETDAPIAAPEAPAPVPPLDRPKGGGSYIRLPNGKLARQEA